MCWNDSDGIECVGCNSRAVGLNNSVVKVQPDRDKENERVESCPRATGNRCIAHCRVKYRDIGGLVNVVSRQPFFFCILLRFALRPCLASGFSSSPTAPPLSNLTWFHLSRIFCIRTEKSHLLRRTIAKYSNILQKPRKCITKAFYAHF